MLPPGIAHGDYDDSYYKPDNDPAAPDTDNVPNQIIASRRDFHRLAGDIAYADPSGAGKPAKFVPSGGELPVGFDKFNPYIWDAYFGSIAASASTTPWMFATGNHDMEAAYPTQGYGGHLARPHFLVMVLPRARRCHRSSRATSPCSRRTQTMPVTRSEQTPGYLGGAQNT